jgi:hypothetical protein
MSSNPNNLPYFKTKSSKKESAMAKFLRRKFFPRLRDKVPNHYLTQSVPFRNLQTIKKLSKRYPYFLRLDISLYYPSINHEILLKKLPEIYGNISHKTPSRRLKQCINNDIFVFLQKSPYKKGLPIGSALSHILAGIFLLDLDLKIKNPFLRYNDDYLIFCKNKIESELILKNTVIPTLNGLNLEINHKKLKSGKFFHDEVDFIGFNFFAGYFKIKQEKIEEFRKEITKITNLNRNKSKEVIIRLLNNKILGFGHYYKFASSKTDFENLDSFIKMRLRRYLLKQKHLMPKEGNLILTNEILKNLGLKSLKSIKEKFDSNRKVKKFAKKKRKIDKRRKETNWPNVSLLEEKYKINYLINQIKELTSLVKTLNKKVIKLQSKLDR